MKSLSLYSLTNRKERPTHPSPYLVKTGRLVLNPPALTPQQFQSQHLAHSISNLEDPKFIASELEQFQNKLDPQPCYKGFSQIARQKSIMLANTQGYRCYKKMKVVDNRVRRDGEKENFGQDELRSKGNSREIKKEVSETENKVIQRKNM